MRVVFRIIRQVEVEHHFKVIDVEPACRHVGRHEKLEASPAKFVHHAVALRLGNIPVQTVRHVAPRVQVLIQVVHHDLGAAKNNAVAEIIHVDQPRERLDLRTPVHFEIRLLDLRRVLRDRVDLDPRRIFRISADQILNRPRNRRREKQELPRRRYRFQDVLDVVAEAHVEHAIRLVENHDLQFIQLHRAALHVVHHATRRPDHHLRARIQRPKLPLVTLPAVNRHAHHPALEQGDFTSLLRDLHRKFTRRT